jgi:hypothetical protein
MSFFTALFLLSLLTLPIDTYSLPLNIISANPVTACGLTDLSQANWETFDIDDTILGFINENGIGKSSSPVDSSNTNTFK